MGGRPGLGSVTVRTKIIFLILDICIIILVIIIFLNGFTKVSLVKENSDLLRLVALLENIEN